MENTLEITVTQEDIDLGNQTNCEYCPIARAASRITGKDVWVGTTIFNVRAVDSKEITYNLPLAAEVFIQQFDRLGPSAVKPFTFVATREEEQ